MLLELGYTLLIRSCIIAYDLKGVNLEQRKVCPGNYKRAYSPDHVQTASPTCVQLRPLIIAYSPLMLTRSRDRVKPQSLVSF